MSVAAGDVAATNILVVRDKRDIYQFVNSVTQETGRAKFLVFTALASVFVDSWDLAGFGAAIPSVSHAFRLHPSEIGLLTASIGVGSLLAAVFGGALVDRLGRLRMFFLDMLLFVVAAAIGAFAPNLFVLVVARFLMGVGIGLDIPAAMSMVAENSSVRHKRSNLNQNLFWQYIANVVGFSISWAIVSFTHLGPDLWRWQMGLGGVVALAIVLTRFFMTDESAFWLASRNQLKAAAEVLQQTYGVVVRFETPATDAPKTQASYFDIFKGRFLIRTVLSSGLNFLQSTVYFAVGFYLPVIISHLFKSFSTALLGTIAIQFAGLLGSGLSVAYANRAGLRRQSAIGFGLEVPLLLLIGAGLIMGWLSPLGGLFVLALFIVVHTFGPGQTGISIAALSYPTELRGRGTGFSYGFGRLGAVLGFYVFPVLLASVGLGKTMIVLALAPLLGCLLAVGIKWDPTGVEADSEKP